MLLPAVFQCCMQLQHDLDKALLAECSGCSNRGHQLVAICVYHASPQSSASHALWQAIVTSALILSASTVLQQYNSLLVVPGHCDVSTYVMLDLSAETVDLGSSEDVMLSLDDELAGLIAAADMPADQAGAHSTKPEPASLVPGKDSVVSDKGLAVIRKSPLHLVITNMINDAEKAPANIWRYRG